VARSALLFLQDIVDAADAIARYTSGGKDAFEQNAMVRDAVLFRLMQIGQAVKNLEAQGLDLAALRPEIPWRNAARTRDRLAHHYWALEADMIWRAVEQLPDFGIAARALLDKQPPPRTPSKRRGKG
jgi:uncharacterized protein with HEPN domain